MGFWDYLKRGATDLATGGLAELQGLAEDSDSQKQQRDLIQQQAGASAGFADANQGDYSALGGEAAAQRAGLGRLASGADSLSAEQLRQSLGQNLATQRSMAASASPSNAAGAARTAAIQSARLGSGLAGQQALAGIQERQAAQRQLAEMIMQQRQQALSGSLGARQTAVGAYGGYTPEGNFLDKYGPAIVGGISAATQKK